MFPKLPASDTLLPPLFLLLSGGRICPLAFVPCLPVLEGERSQGWLLLPFHLGVEHHPAQGWWSVVLSCYAWTRRCPLHRHPSIHLQGRLATASSEACTQLYLGRDDSENGGTFQLRSKLLLGEVALKSWLACCYMRASLVKVLMSPWLCSWPQGGSGPLGLSPWQRARHGCLG